MSYTIEEVAALGGLTRQDNASNWGPCPVCNASKTSNNDDRPPLRFKNSDQWLCVNPDHSDADEPKHGGPVMLARALNKAGTLPDDSLKRILDDYHGESPRPTPTPELQPKADGTLDVAGGWAVLAEHPRLWRERVVGWAAERGFDAEMGRAIVESGSVAAIPAGRWPQSISGWLSAVRWPPRDLLVALRDADGEVVDLERRYIRGQGKPAKGPKTARLSGEQTGAPADYLFGNLPRAIAAARRGEPVVLVEGSSDWAIADACCRLRGKGAALGSYGATALRKVAKTVVRAAKAAELVAGSFTVHVIPDVGDWLEQADHPSHRIGERLAWNAAIDLLDVARVCWCPPARSGRMDLSEHLGGARDPVAAFFKLLRDGHAVLDCGHRILGKPLDWAYGAKREAVQRWQKANDDQLRAHAYRLPLHEFIHYHHYYETSKSTDDKPEIVYEATLKHTRTSSASARITISLERWLATHGIQFSRDAENRWVFDPLERARPPLVSADPERELPRVFKVRSPEFWDGWLQELGYINPAEADGRLIERALRQKAQRAPRSELRPWLCSDGELASPVIRLHLNDRMEEVLQLDKNGVDVVRNGSDRRILRQSEDVPIIEYLDGMTPAEASGLWFRLMSKVTVAPVLRPMMVAHTLLAFIRERLSARPLLYMTGPAGSGKSQQAKNTSTWLTGEVDPDKMTPAAAWEEGQHNPILLLDNLEPRYIEGKMQEFLLTAATSQKRTRRSNLSDRGVIKQRVKALVQMSAISGPITPEMQRRSLLVEHSTEWREPGWSEAEHLEAVRRDRSALWTGAMVLYQHQILPALAGRLQQTFHVPDDHPNESMREALGIMAVIAQSLSLTCSDWGPLDFPQWLHLTSQAIDDIRIHTDPLTLAMDELLLQWNRIVIDRYDQRPRRPALADGLYACSPLYYHLNQRPIAPATPPPVASKTPPGCSLDAKNAVCMRNKRYAAEIVGFKGTYAQLYRDLCRAVGSDFGFLEHIPSAQLMGNNIGNVDGWKSTPVKRLRSGRVYWWTCTRAIEDIEGDERQTMIEDEPRRTTPAGGSW